MKETMYFIKEEYQNGDDTCFHGIYPNFTSGLDAFRKLIENDKRFTNYDDVDFENGYGHINIPEDNDAEYFENYVSYTLLSLPILSNYVDDGTHSYENLLRLYYGVDKVFLDEPIMEEDTIVDALTKEGNEAHGNLTNMLYELSEVLTIYYPDMHFEEVFDNIVDKLDDIANKLVLQKK